VVGDTGIITLALSKGRIFDETLPLLKAAGIEPLDDPEKSRKLVISTNRADVKIIIVRASDVPTYVQYGAADLGIAGKDVLLEHGGDGLYQPLDLRIAQCRMMVAVADDFELVGPGKLDEAVGGLEVPTVFGRMDALRLHAVFRRENLKMLPDQSGIFRVLHDVVADTDTDLEAGAHRLLQRPAIGLRIRRHTPSDSLCPVCCGSVQCGAQRKGNRNGTKWESWSH